MEEDEFKHFFGLRDLYYFLRNVAHQLESDPIGSLSQIHVAYRAFERNFNGLEPKQLEKVRALFFDPNEVKQLPPIREPIELLIENLKEERQILDSDGRVVDTSARFAMVLDDTPDESAIRFLLHLKILDETKTSIFYGSDFPDDDVSPVTVIVVI